MVCSVECCVIYDRIEFNFDAARLLLQLDTIPRGSQCILIARLALFRATREEDSGGKLLAND